MVALRCPEGGSLLFALTQTSLRQECATSLDFTELLSFPWFCCLWASPSCGRVVTGRPPAFSPPRHLGRAQERSEKEVTFPAPQWAAPVSRACIHRQLSQRGNAISGVPLHRPMATSRDRSHVHWHFPVVLVVRCLVWMVQDALLKAIRVHRFPSPHPHSSSLHTPGTAVPPSEPQKKAEASERGNVRGASSAIRLQDLCWSSWPAPFHPEAASSLWGIRSL